MTEEVKREQIGKAIATLDLALWELHRTMGEKGTEVTWHLVIDMKGASPPEILCQDAPGANEAGVEVS